MHSEADIVFWQNSLSAHQAPLMRSLSGALGKRVLLVSLAGASDTRREIGWDDVDYGAADVVVTDDPAERTRIIEQTRGAVAHVFSGIGAYPLVDAARTALASGRLHPHVAVLTESWDTRGIAGLARRVRAQRTVSREAKTVDTFFTIGRQAREQFARMGIDANRIAPFGYAVDDHDSPESASDRVELVFAGDLTEWKNPDLIVDALRGLTADEWRLTMIGDGPLRQTLETSVNASELRGRVRFVGKIAHDETRDLIAGSDALILPSTYDGWGAVVGEALMSGTPALVSDAAGASDLVVGALQGAVFGSRDAAGLRNALTSRTSEKLSAKARAELKHWAAKAISADAFAAYMLSRLEGRVQVNAPWRSGGEHG
ncbi:glycosyltransferase family 4 protein [Leifsonia sp. NPDC058292]|uniref:glycosyltransferase family 4 protein n=1 Tax=Leifsonia sp. NPDC058292 TaxID=3346428 RepID=UPI0036D8C90E